MNLMSVTVQCAVQEALAVLLSYILSSKNMAVPSGANFKQREIYVSKMVWKKKPKEKKIHTGELGTFVRLL